MKKIKWAILVLTILLGMGACTALMPLPNVEVRSNKRDILLEQVNIIDVHTGDIAYQQDILVEDGRIKKLAQHGSISVSNHIQRVAGKGKYVLPGLWDMHAHSLKVSPQVHHPLSVANGVTGIRDMGGCMLAKDSFFACIQDREQWQMQQGQRISPRYVSQGTFPINGEHGVPQDFPVFLKLLDSPSAQQLVSHYQNLGADFLKIYSRLTAAQFQHLATAVRGTSLHLAGHKPLSVSLEEALVAGQRSIEHGRLFATECFADIEGYRQLSAPGYLYSAASIQQLVSNQDAHKCARLMTQMAALDSYWVPTLTTLKMAAFADDNDFRNDSRLTQIPRLMLALFWTADADRKAKQQQAPETQDVHGQFYRLAKQQVKQAYDAGVKILVGTDATDTYVFAGSSMHDEMADLVDAGIPELAVLQAATIEAAKFSGKANEYGSISKGKYADLILLSNNPLVDINALKNIHGVMLNGRLFDHQALAQLSQFSQQQAQSFQLNWQLFWQALSSPLMRQQFAD